MTNADFREGHSTQPLSGRAGRWPGRTVGEGWGYGAGCCGALAVIVWVGRWWSARGSGGSGLSSTAGVSGCWSWVVGRVDQHPALELVDLRCDNPITTTS